MTNLEQLVPSFELCRKIPADAFNGTALVWWASGNKCFVRDRHELGLIDFRTWHEMAPAPTAQEILEAMPDYHLWRDGDNAIRFSSSGANGIGGIAKTPSKLPEMLLSTWMIVRGIETQDGK